MTIKLWKGGSSCDQVVFNLSPVWFCGCLLRFLPPTISVCLVVCSQVYCQKLSTQKSIEASFILIMGMHISLSNCSLLTMMHSHKQKLNGLKILYIYTVCAMIQHQKKVPSGIVMLSKQDVGFLLTTIHWPMPSLYCPLGQWSLSISPHKEFLWCKLMKSWYCKMFLSSFFTHKKCLGAM